MIRVNLLSTGPGTAPPREWLPKEQRAAAFGALLLVVTAAGLGGWWWYLKSQKAGAEVRIDESQAKLDQLKEAVKLVDLAAARKSELTERLGLIDRLRDAKRQPVSLLETVSRSVPEGLWLTSIQQKAGFVTVDGRAMSLTAVTDFVETMQTSGLFKMPVEILSTTTEVVEEMDLVKFSVKAEPLKPAAPVTAPATGTTPVPAKSGV
jgi:type IV pilus assembly protein PilN